MRNNLPLNGLRAFEAVARHGSFAKAADELGVTSAAVSQQIQKLESIIGTALFTRTSRMVHLTEQAQAVLPMVTEGFDSLDLAGRELMSVRKNNVVTISATPSFTSCWLLPRLEHFRELNPHITIQIDARSELVDFMRDDVDIAVRQGVGHYKGLKSELLMADEALVVSSPTLHSDSQLPKDVSVLSKLPLIHIDWNRQAWAAPTWERWRNFHQIDGFSAPSEIRFSMEEHAVKAAIAGLGLALVTMAFIADDLQEGRLVRALPENLNMPTEFHHYVVYPEHSPNRDAVYKLRDWLLSEAKAA